MNYSACSVIIVSYNSRDFLPACLRSIEEALVGLDSHVIVLENGSTDPIPEENRLSFPKVEWLDSKENLGFGKGCNLAVQKAKHPFLFFVNPDTIVSKDAFKKVLSFMETHQDAGTVGCKILNEDGSLQGGCRRNFPSPLSAIFKTLGFSYLFPKSKFFASYNMTYLAQDQEAVVDAISGSFFCISSELYREIGGFDKDYFMYGEDLDLCLRVQQKGYKNYYAPEATILHFRGQSSKTRRLRSYIDFYQAMLIFAKKHKRFHLPYFIVALGIIFAAFIGIFSRLLPKSWKVIPDFLSVVLAFCLSALCFSVEYDFTTMFSFAGTLIISLLFMGEYAKNSLNILPTIPVLALISLLFFGIGYWVGVLPIPFLGLALVVLLFLLLWRRALFWASYFYRIIAKKRHRVILLGGRKESLSSWFNRYSLISGVEVLGCVSTIPTEISSENRQFLMGNLNEIPDICRRTGCREIWVHSDNSGNYENFDVQALLKLGLKVYLLIGGPIKSDFALVNLEYLY